MPQIEVKPVNTAFVTGYTGQDGTFLTKYLLELGYTVIGLTRRISTEPPHRVRGKFDFSKYIDSGQLILAEGDLLSVGSLIEIIGRYRPGEVYNLAAQSHVGLSFKQPELTTETDFGGVVNLITALETVERLSPAAGPHSYEWRLYQASTSEMYGNRQMGTRLNEQSTLLPNSPYAIAKTAAHHYCQMKRAQGKFICCGILFNHESEIRGGNFVTQKIVRSAVEWDRSFNPKTGGIPIELGNLNASRDWGYAADYVKAMHTMLQLNEGDPADYVIATGKNHTVRQFVEAALYHLGGYTVSWKGSGVDEVGFVGNSPAVKVNPEFYRPNEVGYLLGDASLAKKNLLWEPEHSFDDLVRIMVEAAK